ncbi:MAG TPA: TIGR04283 family arsenosugar biosynthesis glycosyltransferase [Candidatus Accumulibacter phosphatis]|nr:MAG: PGL/p-HBAD biosynthesis glycosyltransferase [Candidatus Accumulibacter sp. SK-11]HRL76339.1 TIGR04283 family arsenosugar biosynthesis glycosyltransferase [Candidatus Accumulibacter phosphatis]HRQ94800.1 TIGR04283 family arsenosugar biosynthesis glycosyltransferase [Candidatus Accumulibacter phosphatis]
MNMPRFRSAAASDEHPGSPPAAVTRPASPWLSVIVPVLDEAATISAHLAGLRGLQRQGGELLVVDGGSVDESARLARMLADRVLESARGRAAQMNAGADASRGEVLLFLHADTVLPPVAAELIRAAVAAGATWGRFDVRIDGRQPLLRVVEWMMNWRSRLTGIATGDQAVFVRRDVFEHVGGFPDLPLMEDIALAKRLKRVGRPACLRPPVLTSARRWQKHGVVRTILLMWRLRASYFFGADPRQLAVRYGYSPRQD